MLDINVTGLTLLDVSITYTTTVGNAEAWKKNIFVCETLYETTKFWM